MLDFQAAMGEYVPKYVVSQRYQLTSVAMDRFRGKYIKRDERDE